MTSEALAEYINGGLAVAVIALAIAVSHRVREAVRRRRLRHIVEQTEEWIASLAAPIAPMLPADAGDPRHPASAGSPQGSLR